MNVCHALADLDASINLMPLSIWKNISLPELKPTRMILELADRSIACPKGVAEDVFVKVGKFHFPTDFVVVDFEADPRVNDEAITFNLNQTTRYSSTYDDLLVNRIDIIDVAREEYAQEILGFSNNSLGGNPTSTFKPVLSDSSPSLASFEGSDFILEEIDAYLKDESVLPDIDHVDLDPKGDICLIEKLLNDDPFQLPPMDLKQGEVVNAKSSIEEPSELELKELPSHLEYAYLEGVDKLPVIISKDLKVDEEEALLKCLNLIKGPWVSPIHCIPKKGGINVVENENNELIPTRMPFGLCNAPGIFQRCMMAIFHDMIEKIMDVFMDDFLVFGDSFSSCLSHLDTMLQRFIQDFSKIARPMTHLLEKETMFVFYKDCIDAFETFKKKLTEALILVVPDWNLPFELMCDAGDFAIGAVLEQQLEHKAYWALKHVNFDLKTQGDHQKLQLNELNELRDQAYENSLIYKEKTKKIHDSKIKNRIFNVGDRVLLFNSCLNIFLRKLKTRWLGPFTITKVFPYGTVELSQPDGPNVKVNGHRMKHYFGGEVPQLVVLDLHTFPMDK
nr:reverse transcriptase domain-containing protein [Tanacetum cinerariifolium]